ncbi:hypothetical protein BDV28DRAFT_145016 [Aspergillus coremiiformis]|uniref:Uncharacterized protein n=1 Tax=Aspergillus coremiiformis TaxID=138285 RepID=A0A5N6ZGE7_9EURO|nr:hypothetical protein BDV28DRAFT_145016 [Aspergillus coremiiformis]
MAGSPASGSKPDKTMSSRLLTMKFMQRAAATAAAQESSQTPSAEGSNTPTPKRQRVAPGEQSQSPPATHWKDLEAISAALAAEEGKRREAITRQAAESGETEWVLDFGAENSVNPYAPPPFIVADNSLDADDYDNLAYGGRQSYGNFRRKKKTETRNAGDDEPGPDDDEDEDGDDVDSMINKAKAKASKQPPKFKLSQLTSISGGRQAFVGGHKSQNKRKHK